MRHRNAGCLRSYFVRVQGADFHASGRFEIESAHNQHAGIPGGSDELKEYQGGHPVLREDQSPVYSGN
jgi:hypothetical protein